MDDVKQKAAADLPSGPVIFMAEVIADAIGDQVSVQDERNGLYWIAGGATPQTCGCKVNLRDVAEAVLVNLPDIGYGREAPAMLEALRPFAFARKNSGSSLTVADFDRAVAAIAKVEGAA